MNQMGKMSIHMQPTCTKLSNGLTIVTRMEFVYLMFKFYSSKPIRVIKV